MHTKDWNSRKNPKSSIEMKMRSRKGYQKNRGESSREWRRSLHPFCSAVSLSYTAPGEHSHPHRDHPACLRQDRLCWNNKRHNLGAERNWRRLLPQDTGCWGLNSPPLWCPRTSGHHGIIQPDWEKSGWLQPRCSMTLPRSDILSLHSCCFGPS